MSSTRGSQSTLELFLVDTAATEAIMGLDLMQQLAITIHPASGTVFTVQEEEEGIFPAITGYQHRIILRPNAKAPSHTGLTTILQPC